MFLFSAGFAEGEKGERDLRTVYFESFCYWEATKCGLKVSGRVTELLLPPAWVEAAQMEPALSCPGTIAEKGCLHLRPHSRQTLTLICPHTQSSPPDQQDLTKWETFS